MLNFGGLRTFLFSTNPKGSFSRRFRFLGRKTPSNQWDENDMTQRSWPQHTHTYRSLHAWLNFMVNDYRYNIYIPYTNWVSWFIASSCSFIFCRETKLIHRDWFSGVGFHDQHAELGVTKLIKWKRKSLKLFTTCSTNSRRAFLLPGLKSLNCQLATGFLN